MNNYDQVGELAGVAADSVGSASERMEIYLNSVEAKTNNVKAAWEGFVLSLQQSEGYKNALDFLTFLIDNLPKVATGIASIYAAIKSFSFVKKANDSIRAIKQLNTVTQLLTKLTGESAEATTLGASAMASGSSMALKLASASKVLAIAVGAVAAAYAVSQAIIIAHNKHLSDLRDQVDENARKVSAMQESIDDVAKKTVEVTEINEKYKSGLISNNERITSLQTIENSLNKTYETKIGKINLVNKGYEEQIGLLEKIQNMDSQEQLAELQKGQAARDELLNREVRTAIGSTSQMEKYSREVQNKLADLLSENDLSSQSGLLGTQQVITGTAKNLKKFTKDLENYQKQLNAQGKTKEAQEVGNILSSKGYGFYKGLKEENEMTGNAYEEQETADYLNFKAQNQSFFSDYKAKLEAQKSYVDEFTKQQQEIEKLQQSKEAASTQEEKNSYDKRIKQAEVAKNRYYDLLTSKAKEVEDAKEKLYGVSGIDKYSTKLKEEFGELEGIVPFKTDDRHFNKLKDNFSDLYNEVKSLDDMFEKGQISSKEYFDGLNEQIEGLKTDNIDELKQKLEAISGNAISYADTFIGDLFKDTLPDAKDVENLDALGNHYKKIMNFYKEQSKEGGIFQRKI